MKQRYSQKQFYVWLVVAVAVHALLLFAVLFFQIWTIGHQPKLKIVNVSLVSLPGKSGSSGEHSENGDVPALKSEADAAPEIPPEKSRVSLPADNRQENINKALDRIKHLVAKQAPKSSSQPPAVSKLNGAIARIQQKVNQSGVESRNVSGGRSAVYGTGTGEGSGGTSDRYKSKVTSIIEQNWIFSKNLLKNSAGMTAYVRINILPDGTISQIVFDKRSLSEYLNNSITKAIEKSSPVPVPPDAKGARNVWIGFVFSPEGIEK